MREAGTKGAAAAAGARGLAAARAAARARRFPDLGPDPLRTEGLDRRDAALAWAIDHAVARRWLTLAAVIQAHLSRPWDGLEPRVKGALLAGSAQLLLLDRLPDHAVVNETVEWVKGAGRGAAGSAGLVNAVLRRVAASRKERIDLAGRTAPYEADELPLDDGSGWRLSAPVFAGDPALRLAQQTSHPEALLARWRERLGGTRAAEIARHDLVHPPIIVTGIAEVAGGGDGAGTGLPAPFASSLRAHAEPEFAVFDGERAQLDALLRALPGARVQDPASAAAVEATAALRPGVVIDVCAGRGTKTLQLARLHPEARIIASDASPQRSAALRQLFEQDGRVEVVEPRELTAWAGRADLVLVDPPCSNTGVLARRVEARYRFGPASLGALVSVQRQILADALRLPAGGGHLLYSTCSLEAEENESQVQWLIHWHRLRLRRETMRWPRGAPGDPAAGYSDGSYFALLSGGA